MTSEPLVSVITIFLNAEQFLQEAIESLLQQTYHRWELILVDDGSTDQSTEIARQFATTHPDQIRYVEHAGHVNRGMSASRNCGIDHARGEYLAFLDSDDFWLPDKLKHLVSLLSDNPEAAMVYGPSLYWHSWSGLPGDTSRDFIQELGVQANTLHRPPSLLLRLYPLGQYPPPCVSSFLARREAVLRIGKFEEAFTGITGMYEDQAFITKMCLSENIYVDDQCLDRYRIHSGSCVSQVKKAGKYHEARKYFLEWLEHYLKQNEIRDPRIWNQMQKALRRYRNPVTYHLLHAPLWPIRAGRSILERTLPPEEFRKAQTTWRKITRALRSAGNS